MKINNLLFNENPLVILPELAVNIGLNEAIVLQQLHYWLQKSTKIKDGKSWVYNSIREWQEQFPFWSVDTIRRALNRLINSGIVIKGEYNKTSFDKTTWYTINYDVLEEKLEKGSAKSIYAKCTNGCMQNAQMDVCKMHKPIPETNTETTTDIKERKKENYDSLIEAYTQNKDLREILLEFIKMRKLIKKPLTDKALKLIMSKLDKLAQTDTAKIHILEQSIESCWQGIYPLKEQKKEIGGGLSEWDN